MKSNRKRDRHGRGAEWLEAIAGRSCKFDIVLLVVQARHSGHSLKFREKVGGAALRNPPATGIRDHETRLSL